MFADPPMPAVAPSRDPATVETTDACPHCKAPTTAYHFQTPDGVWVASHRCRECGDVVPMRSAVANLPAPIRDGESP